MIKIYGVVSEIFSAVQPMPCLFSENTSMKYSYIDFSITVYSILMLSYICLILFIPFFHFQFFFYSDIHSTSNNVSRYHFFKYFLLVRLFHFFSFFPAASNPKVAFSGFLIVSSPLFFPECCFFV